jgi:hypothetical protein
MLALMSRVPMKDTATVQSQRAGQGAIDGVAAGAAGVAGDADGGGGVVLEGLGEALEDGAAGGRSDEGRRSIGRRPAAPVGGIAALSDGG